MTLQGLVLRAYELREFQVAGGPDWIRRDRFDITAKPPDDAEPNTTMERLQALLADRFSLVFHMEEREQPVYALVPARSDGRLGPGLTRSDCSSCGDTRTNESNGTGTITATGIPMEQLARWASDRVDRIVLNQTGMTGDYDVVLKYSSMRVGAPATTTDVPALFTALQEQLGLKLEPTRGPVQFLVIDRVEPPIED